MFQGYIRWLAALVLSFPVSKSVVTTRTGEGLTSLPLDINTATTDLDLSNNALTSLADNDFSSFISLRVLRISTNQLTAIGDQAFAGTILDTLYLDGNELTRLPNFSPIAGTLKNLSLGTNRIDVVEAIKLQPLVNLISLSLAGNPLDLSSNASVFAGPAIQILHLEDSGLQYFPNLTNLQSTLQELYLDRNNIRQIACTDTQDFAELLIMQVNSNDISNIESCAFVNTKIKNLELFDNQLTELPYLQDIKPTLRLIDVHGNQIQHVDFEGFGQLRKARLHGNRLGNITSTAFKGTRLQELKLGQNTLTTVPYLGHVKDRLMEVHMVDNHITHPDAAAFQHLGSLQRMSLERNELMELPSTAFLGARCEDMRLAQNLLTRVPYLGHVAASLKKLNLLDNHITHVEGADFQGCVSLEEVRLSGNPLLTLPDLRAVLPSNTKLYIENILFVCCELAWMKDAGTLVISLDQQPCREPWPLQGVDWSSIQPGDLNTTCQGCVSSVPLLPYTDPALCGPAPLQLAARVCLHHDHQHPDNPLAVPHARSMIRCLALCLQYQPAPAGAPCRALTYHRASGECRLHAKAAMLAETLVAASGYVYGIVIMTTC